MKWNTNNSYSQMVIYKWGTQKVMPFIFAETTADEGNTITPLDRASFQLQSTIFTPSQYH